MPSRTGSADLPLYHGGKDGHPYPVPLRVYDETIRVLTEAAQRAKLGNADRLAAIERLDAQARSIERAGRDLEFGGFVAEDRRLSAQYGGRTVFDRAPAASQYPRARRSNGVREADERQLRLPLPTTNPGSR